MKSTRFKTLALVSVLALSPAIITACSQATPPEKKAKSPNTTSQSPSANAGQGSNANKSVDLNKMTDDTVICTVAGKPVTVGDYKRLFKLQLIQLQQAVDKDPDSRAALVGEAQKRGITLSDDEKARALDLAKKNIEQANGSLSTFLKEHNLSEQDFEKQVYDINLGMKTAETLLSQNLLNDLVNRQILINEGKQAGLEKQAVQRYVEIKHSANYDKLLQATGFSSDDLKELLINSELTKLMAKRVQDRKTPYVRELEIRQLYNENKQNFHHNERIRMSQIIVAAPSKDMGSIKSVRTQVAEANPKVKGADLDQMVNVVDARLKQRAAELLMKAMGDENFATLANKYTDDSNAKAKRSGGDMGWFEKGQLDPALSKIVWPMKPGKVVPQMVRTPIGYIIVKVTAHEKAGLMSESDLRPFLRQKLEEKKSEQALAQWILDKRRETKVELSPQFTAMLNNGNPANTNTLSGLNSSVQH